MSTPRRSTSPGWFVYWALTYVLAFAVVGLLPFAGGLPDPDFLGATNSLPYQLFYLVINALIQGLVLGLGGWLLLRSLGKVYGRYIIFNTSGWVLGLSLGLVLVFGLSRLVPDPAQVGTQAGVAALNVVIQLFNALPFFLAGLVLGRFQWLELRKILPGEIRWGLVSGLGFLLFLVVRNGFTFLGGLVGPVGFGATLSLWAASLIPGLMTAASLARVLRGERLWQVVRSGGLIQPVIFLFISLVMAFMASAIGDAVELARSTRPDKVELVYDSGLPADGQTEIRLQALVLNRDGQALVAANVKFEIENRDTSLIAEDGSQIVLPVDEGCIVLDEEVCLPSAIVQSGPEGVAEVQYRLPAWEDYMASNPVRFEARVFESDPESQAGPSAVGEIYLVAP